MAECKAWVMIPKSKNKGTELVVDMRPLVLCKDCKHGQYEEWDNGECVDKTVYCDGYGIHKPDWFCADGEMTNGR